MSLKSWWNDAKDWLSDKWDDANDYLYDKADDFHQGVKSVKQGVQDAKDKFTGLYENSKRAYDETVGSTFDIKPESSYSYDWQRKIAGIPLIGGLYSNYMYGKSQRAYNEQVRNDYNIDWSDTKYPWLSSVWNDKLYQSLGNAVGSVALGGIGGAGVKISKNLKKLYEADLSNKRKRSQRRIDQY